MDKKNGESFIDNGFVSGDFDTGNNYNTSDGRNNYNSIYANGGYRQNESNVNTTFTDIEPDNGSGFVSGDYNTNNSYNSADYRRSEYDRRSYNGSNRVPYLDDYSGTKEYTEIREKYSGERYRKEETFYTGEYTNPEDRNAGDDFPVSNESTGSFVDDAINARNAPVNGRRVNSPYSDPKNVQDDFFYTEFTDTGARKNPDKSDPVGYLGVDVNREFPVGPFSEINPTMGISMTTTDSKPTGFLGMLNTTSWEIGKRRAERLNSFMKYDYIADGINDPATFAKVFPGARPSTANDCNLAFFILLVIGVLMIALCLKLTVPNIIDCISTNEAVKGYEQVEAVLVDVQRLPNYESGYYDYKVSYEYEFGSQKYENEETIDYTLAHHRGLNQDLSKIKGKHFTVFVDPTYPSISNILRMPVQYTTYLAWILFAFGVVVIIIAVRIRIMCAKGMFVAYRSNGRTRLKYFKGGKKLPET